MALFNIFMKHLDAGIVSGYVPDDQWSKLRLKGQYKYWNKGRCFRVPVIDEYGNRGEITHHDFVNGYLRTDYFRVNREKNNARQMEAMHEA